MSLLKFDYQEKNQASDIRSNDEKGSPVIESNLLHTILEAVTTSRISDQDIINEAYHNTEHSISQSNESADMTINKKLTLSQQVAQMKNIVIKKVPPE